MASLVELLVGVHVSNCVGQCSCGAAHHSLYHCDWQERAKTAAEGSKQLLHQLVQQVMKQALSSAERSLGCSSVAFLIVMPRR